MHFPNVPPRWKTWKYWYYTNIRLQLHRFPLSCASTDAVAFQFTATRLRFILPCSYFHPQAFHILVTIVIIFLLIFFFFFLFVRFFFLFFRFLFCTFVLFLVFLNCPKLYCINYIIMIKLNIIYKFHLHFDCLSMRSLGGTAAYPDSSLSSSS